ncbi:MAG: IS1595 family transposase [Acidobacteriia bacterium]|nr:IS1595 family transposase [Terriglobia bacterium]
MKDPKEIKLPRTLQQAVQMYSDGQTCVDTVAALRWPDGVPRCPKCAKTEHYYISTQQRFKCKACRHQFSVKQGSIFEDSPIPLSKWLIATWMLANCRNGVSSYEIARATGVTQKSAWFMLHRLRLAMRNRSGFKLGGPGSECEADETYVGGKLRNMHVRKRAELRGSGGAIRNKAIVMGTIDRTAGKARAEVVPYLHRDTMDAMVRKHVKYGSTVYTDSHIGYDHLGWRYNHAVVNHMEEYVRGRVHTQGIENFWSLLKRGLNGTYVSVEPFHLHRYLDEQVFRYNNRKDENDKPVPDSVRFAELLSQIAGRRLTFAEVTGKVGETTN